MEYFFYTDTLHYKKSIKNKKLPTGFTKARQHTS